jgi:DNA-binding NarL/FixJ family response regulator
LGIDVLLKNYAIIYSDTMVDEFGITSNSVAILTVEEDVAFSIFKFNQQIIKLIKNGSTNKEIAEQLFLSPRTVETHRARILKKLDLKNSLSLVKYINDSFMDL